MGTSRMKTGLSKTLGTFLVFIIHFGECPFAHNHNCRGSNPHTLAVHMPNIMNYYRNPQVFQKKHRTYSQERGACRIWPFCRFSQSHGFPYFFMPFNLPFLTWLRLLSGFGFSPGRPWWPTPSWNPSNNNSPYWL